MDQLAVGSIVAVTTDLPGVHPDHGGPLRAGVLGVVRASHGARGVFPWRCLFQGHHKAVSMRSREIRPATQEEQAKYRLASLEGL